MERELVLRARAGDELAFEDLIAVRLDRLYAAARLILHDPVLAEDAVQETMLRAWRDLPALRDPDRFAGWLHRVLVHDAWIWPAGAGTPALSSSWTRTPPSVVIRP